MKKNKKNFAFELDDEKLNRFKNFSAEEKLKWLAEANAFLNIALTKKQKIQWMQMRAEAS